MIAVAMKLLLGALMLLAAVPAVSGAEPPLPSAQRSFTITLHAGRGRACELFGPVGEKQWSPEWNPEFVSRSGTKGNPKRAVFTTPGHARGRVLWILTAYDCKRGFVQYVVVDPGFMVTVIEIRCTPLRAAATRATVTYRKTALSQAARAAIQSFQRHFAAQGPHWEQAINASLDRRHGAR
jgi:hypothetical protein